MAKTHTVTFCFKVKAGDFLNAGRVASEIKKYLMQLGLNHGLIRKVIICAYEAEINLVIHSVGGEIKLEITDSMIHLFSKDEGPGICDIEQAMKEGYSTASEKAREMGFGAGMGLPNMKKQADSFDIKSSRNGTSIHMTYLINS